MIKTRQFWKDTERTLQPKSRFNSYLKHVFGYFKLKLYKMIVFQVIKTSGYFILFVNQGVMAIVARAVSKSRIILSHR